MTFRALILPISLLALLSATSAADVEKGGVVDAESSGSSSGDGGPRVSWEVEAGVSGIARSGFDGPKKSSDVSVLDSTFSAIASIETRSNLLIRFGFELDRHDFNGHRSQPIPGALQSYALTIGADLQLGDAWLARIDLHPGFYGGDDPWRGDAFNLPITMGASYFVSSDLQLVIGLSIDYNRKYPVLPGVGFRWRASREWVVNAILPAPRIEYNLSPFVTLYAGADLRGDTYRMSDDFGRTRREPKLNDAIADYTQIRVGTGFSWNVNSNTTFQFEAGFVPVNEIDFHRADTRVHSSEVPPYVGIDLKTKF